MRILRFSRASGGFSTCELLQVLQVPEGPSGGSWQSSCSSESVEVPDDTEVLHDPEGPSGGSPDMKQCDANACEGHLSSYFAATSLMAIMHHSGAVVQL